MMSCTYPLVLQLSASILWSDDLGQVFQVIMVSGSTCSTYYSQHTHPVRTIFLLMAMSHYSVREKRMRCVHELIKYVSYAQK